MNPRRKTGILGGGFALATALACMAGMAAASEGEGVLAVKVVGVRGEAGAVCVALYDDAGSYPDEGKHTAFACARPASGEATIVFRGLAAGDYAAFAFHDEDGNRRIRKNFIGMPKEGVGASRGAKGFMGPPKFEDAKFSVVPGRRTISMRLKYL